MKALKQSMDDQDKALSKALKDATNKKEDVRQSALTNARIAQEALTDLRGLFETAQKEYNKHMGKKPKNK